MVSDIEAGLFPIVLDLFRDQLCTWGNDGLPVYRHQYMPRMLKQMLHLNDSDNCRHTEFGKQRFTTSHLSLEICFIIMACEPSKLNHVLCY